MSNNTIGIGVIGCGCRGHGMSARVVAENPQIKVLALCDTKREKAEKSKSEHAPDAVIYDNYQDMVKDPNIQWVMVGSPNFEHREHVVAAFEAGKNVWCEKPLATTLDDCLAMKEAWEKSGKQFSIGFTLRYSPHYLKIKELVDQGAVGDIISFEFNETLEFNHGGFIMADWRRLLKTSGGHLLEKCSHDIDLARWIVGSLPRRVASFGGLNFFTPENIKFQERLEKNKEGLVPYESWPSVTGLNPFTADKEIVDNQVAIIEYANGVRATFHTNCNAGIPERRMYILGTIGAIRADVLEGTISLKKIGFDEEVIDCSTESSGGHGGGDEVLSERLAKVMLEGTAPDTTLDDGVSSTVTCHAIDQAMNTKQVVELADWWKKAGIEMK